MNAYVHQRYMDLDDGKRDAFSLATTLNRIVWRHFALVATSKGENCKENNEIR